MSRKNRERRSRSAAGERKARQSGSDMSKFYLGLAVVAVVGVAIVGYNVFSSATSQAATAPVEVEGLDDPSLLLELAQGITAGDPAAVVTVMEFADYQCPACGQFAGQVKPQIDLAYVETGQVKYVFYDYPLQQHPHAFIAARAARCAGDQNGYWEYHDHLFRNQTAWSSESNPNRTLRGYADELGLDAGEFDACLDSDRYADVVTANMRLGQELRVSWTPTIMVVREGGGMPIKLQENSWPNIQEAIQQALGG